MRSIMALLLSMSQSTTPATGTMPDTVLRPAGPWRMDYTPDECRLIREFGVGAGRISLRLVRSSSPGRFDLVVMGEGIPKLKPQIELSAKLGPQSLSYSFDGYAGKLPKSRERIILGYDGDAVMLGAISNDEQISISAGADFRVLLALTSAKSAIAALNKCHGELLTAWGVEPAELAALQPRPEPVGGLLSGNPGKAVAALIKGPIGGVGSKLPRHNAPPDPPIRWVNDFDYPAEALRQGANGVVTMVLGLDAGGLVARCRVIARSKSEALDKASCDVLTKRAKYVAARDAAGNAVPSTVIERIRWIIPALPF
jgi:TonB family protein